MEGAEIELLPDPPSNKEALICLALLLISLVAVVLLAKTLSYPLDKGIAAAGLQGVRRRDHRGDRVAARRHGRRQSQR